MKKKDCILMAERLVRPHGGTLVDPMVDNERATELREASRDWASWDLHPPTVVRPRAFAQRWVSHLTGFMMQTDYRPVCESHAPRGRPLRARGLGPRVTRFSSAAMSRSVSKLWVGKVCSPRANHRAPG